MELFFLLILPVIMGAFVFILRQDKYGKMILLLTGFIHLLTTISLWLRPFDIQFNSFLGFDAVSKLVLNIISILFFVVSIYLIGYLNDFKLRSNRIFIPTFKNRGSKAADEVGIPPQRVVSAIRIPGFSQGGFIGCLLCLLSAMTLVTLSRHMGLLWISIEATTLVTAPLIHYYRNPQSIEATWKYLLISSLGIAMALLGTFFLSISATNTQSLFLVDILSNATLFSQSWLKLSVIFLLVGYGTKMGLSPMHTWKPDVYGEAPAPVGALMSGAITGCAFLAVFRVVQVCSHAHLLAFISPILVLLGLLSLGISAVFIMGQKDFNRMLGYSSVEHMGIISLGVGLGGAGIWAAIFHLVNNAFAKGMIFLVAGNIYKGFNSKKINIIRGVLRRQPVTGIFLVLGFLVISGFPPFGIFYSELLILKESLITGHYWVVFFYLLSLTVIFFGYSKIILGMALGEAPDDANKETKRESFFMIVPLVILICVLCFTGIFVPGFLYNIIDKASALLGV